MGDIELRGVAKSFGDVVALQPVDLDIAAGQFVSVLGPSGGGKSTLLRCLAGLEMPDAGTIRFAGDVVFDASERIAVPGHRREIAMVFQDLALWPHMTVFENVAFPLKARRRTRRVAPRVAEALDRVHLSDLGHRHPHELSGGQQQRVAIARAIVDRPSVLLMDEPLSALDVTLRIELRTELSSLVRQLGLTTVYVTHDQGEAMAMSDRIVVMADGGSVVQDAAPEDLYQRPAAEFVAGFVGRYNRIDPQLARLPTQLAGIRPERVRLTRRPGDIVFDGRVELVSYLGGRYEARCHVDSSGEAEPWVVYSDVRLEPGKHIQLFVSRADVITIPSGAEPVTAEGPAPVPVPVESGRPR